MLANSTILAPPPAAHNGGDDGIGGGTSNSGDDHEMMVATGEDGGGGGGGDRMSYGGNRWPRQETLALLKIRSDMDSIFRDSSVKGPLWEEVSRKLAELGYHRNAKKCKEKFENVYKYHRRTKEGRTGKSEGKTYRFFDQLEAFGAGITHPPTSNPTPQLQLTAPPPQKTPPPPPMAATTTLPWSNPPTISHATVPSTTNNHQIHMNNINIPPISDPIIDSPNPLSSSQPLNPYPNNMIFQSSFQNLTSHLFSSSTSSSTASDEEMHGGGGGRKRKRRWKDFFERLTKDVIKKQEDLQRRFLETVEKQEQERLAREESWRAQELARINQEHEILIQERTAAAAKDAALISFLQKFSGQQIPLQTLNTPPPIPPPLSAPAPAPAPVQPQAPGQPVSVPVPVQIPAPVPEKATQARPMETNLNIVVKKDNAIGASPSRWPKVEVEALIKLRTNLDIKYQDNGPKGPLWEEISGEMQKLGYNRSSKRCKEKWENINKYFKKVKENRKNRPEDSKTCPYFHQLNAIYKDRSSKINSTTSEGNNVITTTDQPPLVVRPEQQWPESSHRLELNGTENMDEEEDDEEMETEEEDEGCGGFQVVASKPLANPLGNGVRQVAQC